MPRGERPLPGGNTTLLRFAADLRRLRDQAGGPSYRELARRAHYSSTTLSDAAGGRNLPSLAVAMAYVGACGGDLVKWERRWHAVAAELAATDGAGDEAVRGDGVRSPYVGLAAFQPEDADLFHGRGRLIEELIARLARRRFLAVFGASGVGKSSLLRAGLIAKVRADGLTGDGAPMVLMTPGPHPLAELAFRLAALADLTQEQVSADLADDPRHLHRLIRQVVAAQAPDADLLLVIDQFEEVFTVCQDQRERARFMTALLSAAEASDSRARVVIGLRADFYTHCSDHPELVAALNDSQVLVGPMTTEELRQAITQPASRSGCSVEGSLVAAIVADAAGRPGALPLVSHTLVETWRRRRGNSLTLAGYQAAGGIHGALAQTAETLYTALPAEQQRLSRELFLRLTAIGEGTEDTKRRIARDELDTADPDTGAVLERLANARLITRDKSTVELAHEALIAAWPRLHQWLTADRDGLRTHRQLTHSANTWAALNRDTGVLYRGARLMVAREWAARHEHRTELNPLENAFLDASINLADREQAAAVRRGRQLRSLVVGLAVLLLVVTGISVVALQQRHQAVNARQTAVSRQLATQALTLVDSEPDTAMLLSVEALRTAPTAEARSAVLSMSGRDAYQAEFAAHTGAVSEVTFTPDGRTLATAGADHTVALWDVPTHSRLATLTGHDTWLKALALSPDGTTLASGGDDSNVVLWDVASRARTATLTGHTGEIKEIAFSPDGRTLATASADHTVTLWDVAQHSSIARLAGHRGAINGLAFSPDGRTLATASADHTVVLWDVAQHTATRTLTGHTDEVSEVVFSPDGRGLASAGGDKTVLLWDVAGGTPPAALTGHTGWVIALKYSPDGRTLASAGNDKTVLLWDTGHRTLRARMTGHSTSVYTLAFSPTSPLLASAGEGGSVILWDTERTSLAGHIADGVNDITFSPHGHTLAATTADQTTLWDTERRTPRAVLAGKTVFVNAVAFSPDGDTIATANEPAQCCQPPGAQDNTLTLWSSKDGTRLATFSGHTDRVLDVAFSPDGRTLATGSVDKTVIVWDATTGTRLATLTGHTQPINGVAFSQDGGILATASHDHTVMLWDTERWSPRTVLSGHTGWVRSATFSPDGRTLATASHDSTVMLWDVATGARLATVTGHVDAVFNGVMFSPDGRTLAFTSGNHTVVLWDVERRSQLARLTGHTQPVTAVAFSPDGRTLATSGTDQTVMLWSTDAELTATRICDHLRRDLTPDEWHQLIPDLPYRRTCPS